MYIVIMPIIEFQGRPIIHVIPRWIVWGEIFIVFEGLVLD